ncbi:hypothetical protein BN11_2330010 [Nostocoides australiense Ben110]|uniref:DUF4190 domain-containing protein n=1 Tax=Nostocoides australiense Ben110 TaxID=1193182 RepID=W6JUN2_9MICO|nr:hypothetical protein [Tetrasphaera australiensis]CCH73113.1 hypothetical protein BN11_2330010 [Tetrasphaera australiensis Ben110]
MRRTPPPRTGLQPLPPRGMPRSRVQDAPAPDAYRRPGHHVRSAPGRPVYAGPVTTGDPYGSSRYVAARPTVNGSAIALVVLSSLCLFPLFMLTQVPALVFGVRALAAQSDPQRSARLARHGWWAFALGLAALVALFLIAAAALVGVLAAAVG